MLEYIPGGSLEDQEDVTASECVSIVVQCTSALAYLHGHDPPIVHRDIKPSNILIQERDVGYIHVKFGDFGLAKDYDNLSTICGSWRYLAPEMYQNRQYVDAGGKQRVTYTAAVDVWSLGVVVYELLCDLPPYRQKYECSGTSWCEEIIKTFQKDFENGSDQLRRFLLEAMVVLLPTMRWSAQECFTQAELLASSREHSETQRTASHADKDEQATILFETERSIADGKQTVIWRPNSYGPVGTSTKASAPSQSSVSATQKRVITLSTSSSSSERHNNKRLDNRSRPIEPTSSRQLEPLPRYTQELGGWEQDCHVLSGYLPEHLTPQIKSGNDGLDERSQTGNNQGGQEAADAKLLLRSFSPHTHTASRFESVTPLSRKL